MSEVGIDWQIGLAVFSAATVVGATLVTVIIKLLNRERRGTRPVRRPGDSRDG